MLLRVYPVRSALPCFLQSSKSHQLCLRQDWCWFKMHLILLLQAVHLSSLELSSYFWVAKCIRRRWDHLYLSRNLLLKQTDPPAGWCLSWPSDILTWTSYKWWIHWRNYPLLRDIEIPICWTLCCNKSWPTCDRWNSKITSLFKTHGFTLLYTPMCWAWGKLKYMVFL